MKDPVSSEFFKAVDHPCGSVLDSSEPIWAALPNIKKVLGELDLVEPDQQRFGQAVIRGRVFIGEGTRIDPGVFIQGPAWIGRNCHLRPGAYLRGNVIAGDDVVFGNSCEFKNSILMDGAQIAHYSYVGDSILGHRAHLGAGAICSNLRTDQGEIQVRWENQRFSTGLRKFGAILGDEVEIGCQCVLNPGSVIGPRTWMHPGVVWAGACPAESRIQNRQITSWTWGA